MKPAAFDLVRARSIAEAARLLAEGNGEARIIAGGQSLAPMLNLRLTQPRLLIDVTGIEAMSRVEDDGEALILGACVTTASLEDGAASGIPVLAEVAGGIAYRAVRNRATIGGSLCHADPAADWVSALSALGAECLIAGAGGSRRLAVGEFIVGAFETALAGNELLAAVRIPRSAAGARWGYSKLCRRTGEFAMAIGAALHDANNDRWRLVSGATNGRPIVVEDAHPLLRSGAGDLDRDAVLDLFDRNNMREPVSREHHFVVLQRAFARAMQS